MAPPRAGRRRPPGLVTLTSDLGWAYAAQVKGALLRTAPRIPLVDLAHDLPRHQISEAAFVFRAMASSFPAGTIHVAVVDPGVGGARFPVAIRCGEGSVLIGPDNGVLSPLASALGRPQAFRLDPERVATGPRVGTTFDGRDLFAPAAGRIANGESLSSLGTKAEFQELRLPVATRISGGVSGEVVHVDHFGNLITNVPTPWIPRGVPRLSVAIGPRRSTSVPWVASYETLGRGRAGSLGSSFGTVEVAVADGSASARFRGRTGTPVVFRWGRSGAGATATVNTGRRLRARRR
ncbi:MAG: SAM-dependent chlorinase/fluorinase [Thermoplasmata archaeon]|nr:SAM-dependent chlorinase/fluorinase [Thermoplasmata archaeon]